MKKVENVAATEPHIILKIWWRPNKSLKKSEYWTSIHQDFRTVLFTLFFVLLNHWGGLQNPNCINFVIYLWKDKYQSANVVRLFHPFPNQLCATMSLNVWDTEHDSFLETFSNEGNWSGNHTGTLFFLLWRKTNDAGCICDEMTWQGRCLFLLLFCNAVV